MAIKLSEWKFIANIKDEKCGIRIINFNKPE